MAFANLKAGAVGIAFGYALPGLLLPRLDESGCGKPRFFKWLAPL